MAEETPGVSGQKGQARQALHPSHYKGRSQTLPIPKHAPAPQNEGHFTSSPLVPMGMNENECSEGIRVAVSSAKCPQGKEHKMLGRVISLLP